MLLGHKHTSIRHTCAASPCKSPFNAQIHRKQIHLPILSNPVSLHHQSDEEKGTKGLLAAATHSACGMEAEGGKRKRDLLELPPFVIATHTHTLLTCSFLLVVACLSSCVPLAWRKGSDMGALCKHALVASFPFRFLGSFGLCEYNSWDRTCPPAPHTPSRYEFVASILARIQTARETSIHQSARGKLHRNDVGYFSTRNAQFSIPTYTPLIVKESVEPESCEMGGVTSLFN